MTGGGAGKPAGGKGIELTRAATVLLAAALEGFVEDLFDQAVDLIHADRTDSERKKFKKATSGRFGNADVAKTDLLFSHLGYPWIMDRVNWQKFSNSTFKHSLETLVVARNKIAHGRAPDQAQLKKIKDWKNMVERYATKLESLVADHVATTTGTKPAW